METCPVCGNTSCNICLERIFAHGAAPCPVCRTVLRKSSFAPQVFEDLQVEKECRIRRLIFKYMNKVREDFSNAREYEDYLEQVEDYTFRLMNNESVQQVYDELESFRSQNAAVITKNIGVQMRETQNVQISIEKERHDILKRDQDASLRAESESRSKEQDRINLIKELESSDKPAAVIVQQRSRAFLPSSSRSSRVHETLPIHFQSISKNLYPSSELTSESTSSYNPLEDLYTFPFPLNILDSYFDPITDGWADTAPLNAGGSTRTLFHRKAIQEAMRLFLPTALHIQYP